MGLAEEFNIEQTAEEIASLIHERMQQSSLPPDEIPGNAQFIFEFCKIAGNLILQEPGAQVPGSDTLIPFDVNTANRAIQLFAEGVYSTFIKAHEMGLPADIKMQLIQAAAQEIFAQSKQIVASTVGQEDTPEYQIPLEQQMTWVNQAAETILGACISQYESTVGPITLNTPSYLKPIEDNAPAEGINTLQHAPESSEIEHYPLEPSSPYQPEVASRHNGPHPHDKYAAVALFLTTLKPSQHGIILKRFKPDERSLIEYYQQPENIENNLDVGCVEQELKKFQDRLKQGGSASKSKITLSMEEMAQKIPQERLLSTIEKERPYIHEYVTSFYQLEDEEPAEFKKRQGKIRQFPPKIEKALYHFIAKQVASG